MSAQGQAVDTLGTVESLLVDAGPRQRALGGWSRVAVETDGEIVLSAAPSPGLAHRGIEKLAESRRYDDVAALLACFDTSASSHAVTVFALALERLAGIEVPEKASWMRSFVLEVERAASHAAWLAAWTLDEGLTDAGSLAARQSDALVRLLDETIGERRPHTGILPGGMAADMRKNASATTAEALASFETAVDELEARLARGGVLARAARGAGALDREQALGAGATGPCLRGSGGAWDVRRTAPYAAYASVSFGVPLGVSGDCWDRCMVRIEEMRWSARMALDMADGMPSGAHATNVAPDFRPPAGEAYAAVESPRGELGVHLISDGSERPYRLHVRPPSFYNLGAAAVALAGVPLDEAAFVLGSFDLSACEAER